MLYRKESFTVREFTDDDSHNLALSAVLFEPDGSTVACNGSVLAKYTPKHNPPLADFPVVDGFVSEQPAFDKPVLVDGDALADVQKAIPKRQRLPVLEHAALDLARTAANGHAYFVTTDLESPRTMQIRKNGGAFPRYESVIPKDTKGAVVGLSLEYLERIAKMMRQQGMIYAKLTVRGAEKPITLESSNDHGESLVVLMPCQL